MLIIILCPIIAFSHKKKNSSQTIISILFPEINDIKSTRALPNIVTSEPGAGFPTIPLQEHSPIIVPPIYNQLWGSQFPPGLMSIAWNQMMMPQQQTQQQQQQQQQQPMTLMMPRNRPTSSATNRDISVNSSGYGSQMSFSQFNNVSTSPISETNGCKYRKIFLIPFNFFAQNSIFFFLVSALSLSSNTSSLSTPQASPRNQSPTMPGLDQLSLGEQFFSKKFF